MTDTSIQELVQMYIGILKPNPSVYQWVHETTNRFEDEVVHQGHFMFFLSTSPIIVERVSGKDKSVIIIGQMSLACIRMIGIISGIKCDLSCDGSGSYRLLHKDSKN